MSGLGGFVGVAGKALSFLNRFIGRMEANEHRADGMRRNELDHRDKQDEVSKDAAEHRKVDNSSTDDDVLDRL